MNFFFQYELLQKKYLCGTKLSYLTLTDCDSSSVVKIKLSIYGLNSTHTRTNALSTSTVNTITHNMPAYPENENDVGIIYKKEIVIEKNYNGKIHFKKWLKFFFIKFNN